MRGKWACWTVVALAASLLAVPAQAKETEAKQIEMRVDVRARKPGEEPAVRMWVNGKEVEPGKNVGPGDKGRGALGVMIAPLDDATAERADVKAGAVIQGTTPGSAAEKAGLREGDVITRVDGKRIESPQQLAEYIGDRRPGDRVRLEWSRDGRRMSEAVILGRYEGSRIEAVEREAEGREEKEAPPTKDEPREGFLGVMVSPLTDDIREFAGTDSGVLINSLTDESPAAKAGLQAGDVITHVDDREVGQPGDLVEAMRERKVGDRVHVVYFRKGERREARVRLGERPGERPRRKEGTPLFDLPGDLFGNMPELQKYFEQLRPNLEEWAKRFREQQGKLRPDMPGPAPQFAKPTPAPKIARPKPEREPYDVGKDMGRILERLERIERRLDEMEKRLGRRER